MKKSASMWAAAAALILLSITGCSGGTSGSSESAAASGDVIYVTNTPIGVNQFLQLGEAGTKAVAEQLGVGSQTFESTDLESRRANLDAAIAAAPSVVVLITFDFTDLAAEYAANYPDQQFLLIDACPADSLPNLHCAVFKEQEGAYLAGVEAGYLSTSKKVGSVIAVDNAFLHRYSDAFAQGAQSVDPAITDTQLVIGGTNPFSDPATAKEQALSMAQTGVDAIFAVAAGSNGGVFEAAEETNTYAWGVDVDQCPVAPGRIVDNVTKAVDVVVVDLVQKIVDGSAEAITAYGLESGGLSLTSLQDGAEDSVCVVMEHPDILEAVEAAKDQIISGEVEVIDPSQG